MALIMPKRREASVFWSIKDPGPMVFSQASRLPPMATFLDMDAFTKLDGVGIASITTAVSVLAVPLWWWYQHQNFKRYFGEATYRPAFAPLTLFGMLYGLGLHFTWDQRFTLYKKEERELISLEPTVWGKPVLYSNSVEVMRQIGAAGVNTPWFKPTWSSASVLYWGKSVLATNGHEWKKHRRVLQPAFNPKLYEMVWTETSRLFNEMMLVDKWPTTPNETKSCQRAHLFTQRLGLCVILSCGFGLPVSWNEKTYADDGFSLDEGVKFQGENVLLISNAPAWVYYLPFKKLQYALKATTAMRKWFNSAVSKKKEEIAQIIADTDGDMDLDILKKDVFTRLTMASQTDSKSHMDDSDIIGNTWVMYFAGHESTATSIAAALCLLASHKKEQEDVFEEIQQVVKDSDNGALNFESYASLVKTRSVFVEAVRMYPAGSVLIRETREDTILQVPSGTDANGNLIEQAVPIPKGTCVIGDMVGIQYNPRVYPEPGVFRPSRWHETTNDEAYTAFSVGPRACLGRRFALAEAVCFLSNILRNFEVEPILEPGEKMEGWKERVLGKTTSKLTLNIAESPLIFRRRQPIS